MKIFSTILFIVLSCANFYAQDKTTPSQTQSTLNLNFDNGCGNPFVESQLYGYRMGEVTSVTSTGRLKVKVTHSNNVFEDKNDKNSVDKSKLLKPQLFTVSLVGIDESVNINEMVAFLNRTILNKQVTIIGNTKKSNKNIEALVESFEDDVEEINEYLLENGIAKFKQFSLTNLVPMRTFCVLEKAELRAKKEKRGIWKK